MIVHERLLLPNLGREGAVFMVRAFGCWFSWKLCPAGCPGKDGMLLTRSLHVQDWVVEHWDRMPRYGEGSTLAAALLCRLLGMVQHVLLQHSWMFACACTKLSLQGCLPDYYLTRLQSSFSMATAQRAGMATVRCVLALLCAWHRGQQEGDARCVVS